MSFDERFGAKMSSHSFQIGKRQRVSESSHPEILEMSGSLEKEPDDADVQTLFFNRRNAAQDYSKVSPVDFDFERSIMEQTPGADSNLNESSKDKMRDVLEGVTRAYEDAMLCEPVGDQRACVNGKDCEGMFVDKTNGFVLREFLLPSQLETYKKTKRYPLQVRDCVMCARLKIARFVIGVRADATGMREDVLCQDYYNFTDIPGEYRLEDCLLSKKNVWEGVICPVVLHVRNAYKFEVVEGRRVYKQWKFPFLTLQPGHSPGTTLSSASID